MAKRDKNHRPTARIPRGFRDRLGAEIAAERDMLAAISQVYEAWGFDPLETPAFEYTDALGKFLPDIDRPNQGVFSLQDDDEQWMSLRYDLTAPLARFVAQNYEALPKPFRRYQVGPVWRNEKPGPGRFRQFTQCDADSVGAPAPHADVEMCLMFGEVMDAAIDAAMNAPIAARPVSRPQFVIRFNDRNVLTGLLDAIGVDEERDAEKKLRILRAMDKLDRLGPEGVRLLLGEGRKDESGDYTDGAKLAGDEIERVIAFMSGGAPSNAETCNRLAGLVGGSPAGVKGVETLAAMAGQLSACGLDETRARIDLSLIRGLDYYTGPVFEAELISTELGASLGSVGGGGRYDDLVKRFKGVEVPAVGVSIGVSRLMAAFEFATDASRSRPGPVVILALENDQMAAYQAMARELRQSGVRAEVYLGGAGMRTQLKYADKRAAPVAVIQGGDERAKGEVTIKDLVLGAALSKEIEDNAEWREAQPAQFSVPRGALVEAVKNTLARKR